MSMPKRLGLADIRSAGKLQTGEITFGDLVRKGKIEERNAVSVSRSKIPSSTLEELEIWCTCKSGFEGGLTAGFDKQPEQTYCWWWAKSARSHSCVRAITARCTEYACAYSPFANDTATFVLYQEWQYPQCTVH